MKMLFVIIEKEDKRPLTNALVDIGVGITRMSTTGGFLHSGNTTLMIVVDDDRVKDVLAVIKEKSSRRHSMTVSNVGFAQGMDIASVPITVMVGGATVFILNVEEQYKF